MQKVEVLVSIPAAGKSTYCRELMKKEPGVWKRINNDDLRSAIDLGVYSPENEKIIRSTRQYLLKEFLAKGYSVLMDNLNIGKRNWEEITKIAQEANRDVQCYEKIFYIDLEEAIARDSKREGKACVGKEVIEKWWKESGKTQMKHQRPRVEIFARRSKAADRYIEPMQQNESLPRAVIFDNDGTISLVHDGRSPYDASTCDLDAPHKHVIECMKLYHQAGYKILFVSGREDKDRTPTEKFYQQYFPEVKYELFMRQTGDKRKDVIIKEEIFNEHIKDRYFVAGWFDDRLQVSKWVYESGLPLFRVNDPEANF